MFPQICSSVWPSWVQHSTPTSSKGQRLSLPNFIAILGVVKST